MLKISLLENAFDYILDAVNRLAEEDSSKTAIKYAIVHLWSGIELLLKKRLMDEHWSLIFRDVNKAHKSSLESGDFISVHFDELIKRLRKICNVDVNKFKDILVKLREDRNRLEHFQIEIPKMAAISKLIKAWGFLLDFSSSQINFTEETEAKELFEKIRSKMVIHEKFIKERWNDISMEIKKNEEDKYPYTVIECPECFQEAMFLLGGSCQCKFCRIVLTWRKAMDKWLTLHEGRSYIDPKQLMVEPLVFECPECGMDALYQFEHGDVYPPDPGWTCFHCGGRWAWDERKKCARCDRPYFVSSGDDPFCGQCWPDG